MRDMDDNILVKLRTYFSQQPVSKAWMFGSVSRGEATPNSDVDILVNFDEGVGLLKYSSMVEELESIVNKAVDLVSESALFPWVKPSVDRDKILIYERKA